MFFPSLIALSPIDGRYREKVADLFHYFSEYALMKYRVRVEVEYFIALCDKKIPQLASINIEEKKDSLRSIYRNFSIEDAEEIKETEKTTNHDVKAVEYFVKKRLETLSLGEWKEFVHFGLTSQDINNTSIPLAIKEALQGVYYSKLNTLISHIEQQAEDWKNVPMLARTHGQPASPTKLGKELRVFSYRLMEQLKLLKEVPISGKFGGATGNFNAHKVAYKEYDWEEFANQFLEKYLSIQRERCTTQISNYDNLSALFDGMKRINTILIDLDRDIWQYISMGYFKQKIKEGEVGSSAMPHKINPIDFENSEGNLGLANAILQYLSTKLPISRLQRDLTDSTTLRNVGLPFAYSIVAMDSTLKGLNKLILNTQKIEKDLEDNWAVVAEGIQTILRREGFANPYETLKKLTRTNQTITQEVMRNFIDSLEVSNEVKEELRDITPTTYTGV
ncbi:MAG TPA: adenylosuccinate lyase [Porphyromonadaceae bacterium]|nr:adenylosuccinate lyase [Porphyromonadaceae bacterium]